MDPEFRHTYTGSPPLHALNLAKVQLIFVIRLLSLLIGSPQPWISGSSRHLALCLHDQGVHALYTRCLIIPARRSDRRSDVYRFILICSVSSVLPIWKWGGRNRTFVCTSGRMSKGLFCCRPSGSVPYSARLSGLSRIPDRLLAISVITIRTVPAWRWFSHPHCIPTVSRAYSGWIVDQVGGPGLEPGTHGL